MDDDDVKATSTDDEAPASGGSTSSAASGGDDDLDPNGIVSKQTMEIWVAPGWTDWSPTKKEGWQSVKSIHVMHRDGRKVVYIDGGPGQNTNSLADGTQYMSPIGAVKVDKDQEARFRKDKAAAEKNKPVRTTTIRGADGKNHIMQFNPDTGKFDIDQGLAPSQPTPEKKPPSEAKNWQPLTGPDGKVVALLDPSTGDTVAVSQKDPQKPDVFQTKDGQIITVSPDGKSATNVTPPNPNDKAPPAGLDYEPDDTAPDDGLAAYNKKLMDAWRAGTITKEAGQRLLERAGDLYERRETVASKRRDQDTAVRGQAITQRGQNLGEVASRRQDANRQFSDVGGTIDKLAADLIPADGASGQTIVDAYRAMLGSARRHAEEAGGFDVIPDVPMPAMVGGRPMDDGTGSTQIVMRPGGSIEVSPVGAAPITTPAPTQNAGLGTGEPPARGNVPTAAPSAPINPAAGQPGNDPTKPVGLFDPTGHLQDLISFGLTPEEAKNAVALYGRGVREADL